ncbi:MAG: chromate transporter [Rikenellaceae bacterium]
MKELFSIFISFFKIGCFTFGGGYAMILIMEREICQRRQWVTKDEFLNYLSLSQASPGPMAVNIAILIGYHRHGWKGGLCGFLGSVLPSFIILLTVAIFFRSIYTQPSVVKVFKGLRPAVVALILYPVFAFAKNVNRWEYPIIAAVGAVIYFGLSPIYIIMGCVVFGLGYAYYKYDHYRK